MNLTHIAIKNQLNAFNCPLYEIGVKSRDSGKMSLRDWDADTIIKSIEYLKSQNSKNHDIFIRPYGQNPFIFIDDLPRSKFELMKRDGFNPAIIIESSPYNFHGWVKLSNEPIKEQLATEAAKYLAVRYGGDPNSADWRHFGRLAGFTNRKPEHFNGSNFPFVKIHVRNGKIARNGEKLLKKLKLVEPKIARDSEFRPVNTDGLKPSQFFLRQLKSIENRYGAAMDVSKADWMIVNQMKISGFSYKEIEIALYDSSPYLKERKKGHIADYVQRTLNKAFGVKDA